MVSADFDDSHNFTTHSFLSMDFVRKPLGNEIDGKYQSLSHEMAISNRPRLKMTASARRICVRHDKADFFGNASTKTDVCPAMRAEKLILFATHAKKPKFLQCEKISQICLQCEQTKRMIFCRQGTCGRWRRDFDADAAAAARRKRPALSRPWRTISLDKLRELR